jgi:UDP:flavonoid glycosyltransferase YjiC (YdhE family)
MRIVILAIGSRGDVQPYLALGVGFRKAGHDVLLAADAEFEALVRTRDLDFFPLRTRMRAHMLDARKRKVLVAATRNPFETIWLAWRTKNPDEERRKWEDCWSASQGAEVIISSQAAYQGRHIAEKLGVPNMPASYTPFIAPEFLRRYLPRYLRLGRLAYRPFAIMLGQLIWQSIRTEVNRARKEILGLPPAPFFGSLRRAYREKIPVLWGFSRFVVPRPAHWPPWFHVTGHWFLDHPPDWQPPPRLVEFLAAGPPPVSIGFGSTPAEHTEWLTANVLEALRRSEQRGVLLAGWTGLGKADVPDDVLVVDDVPHDWLFPRVAAAVHHGGAGTTAASLRAGVPTVIAPSIADHYFWAERVVALGVGPPYLELDRLTADQLAAAIRTATTDQGMRDRARALGERIRAENGVARAVEVVEEYARRVSRQ